MSDGDLVVPARGSEPSPKLVELARRLCGRWRVEGQGIVGVAECRRVQADLLVMRVDFSVNGSDMHNIQHITYDPGSGLLRAHYMDTMGDESTYTWRLDGRDLRVSLLGAPADTFFAARFDHDYSAYTGRWQYSGEAGGTADESITYTRIRE